MAEEESMTLPPLNEYSRCLKCGNRRSPEVKWQPVYCSHMRFPQCEMGLVPPEQKEWEHHHRVCIRCGYMWAEACLTAEEQVAIARQNLLEAGVSEDEIAEQ